ncbi:MAG: HD domain-containing protein [Caldimicrobium sp.]|nr:HD domain-containing protein [Caldimicrobium sp.]
MVREATLLGQDTNIQIIESLVENQNFILYPKDFFECLHYLIRFRNPNLYLHASKVGIVSYLLALKLGYPTKFADLMQYAGWVHDLGLIFVPLNIQDSFLRITLSQDSGWERIYKLHPIVGAEILGKVPALNGTPENLTFMILHHHENWDGTGFPKGLKGKEIPIGGRILRIADTFVRLVDSPPRGEGLSVKDAFFEILKDSKKIFDPHLVSSMIEIEDTLLVWLDLVEKDAEKEIKYKIREILQ